MEGVQPESGFRPAPRRSFGKKLAGWLENDNILGAILIAPLALVIVGLVAYPLFSALWLSLNEKVVGGAPRFIGFEHYARLIRDGVFRLTIVNNFVYTFFIVACKLLIGTFIALLINKEFKGRSLIRGLLLLPWAVPALVTALTWRWMYDDMSGVFNYILMSLGLIKMPVSWLANMATAMPAVIIVSIWRGTPFFAMTLLAGLQSVPTELYEAAEVDGANRWHKFRHVDLPGLMSVAGVVTLLATIWTFNEFQVVYVLTQGGPAHATELFSTLAYQIGIGTMRLGEAAACSLMFLPFIGGLIVVATKWMLRRDA
jgi:multiple sugar transport system permease protein